MIYKADEVTDQESETQRLGTLERSSWEPATPVVHERELAAIFAAQIADRGRETAVIRVDRIL